jgi:hypothetical protein
VGLPRGNSPAEDKIIKFLSLNGLQAIIGPKPIAYPHCISNRVGAFQITV